MVDVIDVNLLLKLGVRRYSVYWNEKKYLRLILVIECMKNGDRDRVKRHLKRIRWDHEHVGTLAWYYAKKFGYEVDCHVPESGFSLALIAILDGKFPERDYLELRGSLMGSYDMKSAMMSNFVRGVTMVNYCMPYSEAMQEIYAWKVCGVNYNDMRLPKKLHVSAAWYLFKKGLEHLRGFKRVNDLIRYFKLGRMPNKISEICKMQMFILKGEIKKAKESRCIMTRCAAAWIDDDDMEYVSWIVDEFGGESPKWLIDKHYGPNGMGRKEQIEKMEEYNKLVGDSVM